VDIHLNGLDPQAVAVQLYADPQAGEEPEIHPMTTANVSAGPADSYLYRARVPIRRPQEHYTPRIIPHFDGAAVPLDAGHILWYGT
jgi:starch phosphorylase